MPHSDSRVEPHRPSKLYFYGDRVTVERALHAGEFQLRPTSQGEPVTRSPESIQILPFGARKSIAGAGFLTLSLSSALSNKLFHPNSDGACIVITDTEEFGERLHRAVRKALPQWAGIDAPVAYGAPSPLGVAFTKSLSLAAQKEWLFAWRPIDPGFSLHPVLVEIGSIADFAELRQQSGQAAP